MGERMGSYNWRDEKKIDRFVFEWPQEFESKGLSAVGDPDPIEELRSRLAQGIFGGQSQKSVAAYLEKVDAKAQRLSADGLVEREERAVAAAERSARWAGWSIVVSLAAPALAGWGYVMNALG